MWDVVQGIREAGISCGGLVAYSQGWRWDMDTVGIKKGIEQGDDRGCYLDQEAREESRR